MTNQPLFVGVTITPSVSPNEPSSVHRAIGAATCSAMLSGKPQTVIGKGGATEYTVTPQQGKSREWARLVQIGSSIATGVLPNGDAA